MCKCFNKNKAIAEETNTISGPGQFYNQRCNMRRILNWKLWKLPTKQKDGGRSREGGGASWNLILGQNLHLKKKKEAVMNGYFAHAWSPQVL